MAKEVGSTSIIDRIDAGLSRYYAIMEATYEDNQFREWCDDNGFDSDDIEEELGPDGDSEILLDFDEHFPTKLNVNKNEDEISREIYTIIQYCSKNEHAYSQNEMNTISSAVKFLQSKTFDISAEQLQETRQIYEKQCPYIFDSGAEDKTLLTALAVGYINDFGFLQILVDLYMRSVFDVYKKRGTMLSVTEWAQNYPYFKSFQWNGKIASMLTGSINSFSARICPKLSPVPYIKIQDSLGDITDYIRGATRLVKTLTMSKESGYPFQMDFCIAFANTIASETGDNKDNDDDPDDQEEESIELKENEKSDDIGDIASKLNKNNLKYASSVVSKDTVFDLDLLKVLFQTFKRRKFENILKSAINNSESYPAYNRFIAFVDRRNSPIKEDEVIMYEPPESVRNIPKNAVPEWYLNASKTCILPNADVKLAEKESQVNNSNITSLSSCGGKLLTLSFHVKDEDNIKCYLYLDGKMCRFFAEDVFDILPSFFDEKFGKNSEFAEDLKSTQNIVLEIKDALPDREYNACKKAWERDI